MKNFKYNVVKMIRAVRDRPCIWDKTLEIYKDRVERRRAWEEIFSLLEHGYENMTAEQKRVLGENILRKWTNIRDIFAKSLKPRDGKAKRKYVLHDEMKFLIKIYAPNREGDDENEDCINEVYQAEDPVTFMKREGVADINDSSHDAEPNMTVTNISNFTKKHSKVTEFDDSQTTNYSASGSSFSGRKKSKRHAFSDDGNDTFSGKKSRKNTHDDHNDEEADRLADIDFVHVEAGDDPRVMNEDEAFFASLLPTVVKYNEDEKLEFRIEVLGIMKQIKDKRKWAGE